MIDPLNTESRYYTLNINLNNDSRIYIVQEI